MQKQIVKYNIADQPFNIPMKIRKKLPVQKNLFELNQPQVKKPLSKQLQQIQSQLVDPLLMDSSLIKSLLFGKIQSYLILMSLTISTIIVYNQINYVQSDSWAIDQPTYYLIIQQITQGQYFLLLLSTFISLLLIVISGWSIYYAYKNNQIRGLTNNQLLLFIKITIIFPHPNIWYTDYNYLFHLILVARLAYVFTYLIETSAYHDNRAFRLTQIYGIKPNQNFMFAIKSLVEQMGIKQVIFVYFITVLIFSHCLFLAGLNQQEVKSFSSCFQIIIVTLPTIGYGQYEIDNLLQRVIIVMAVVVGLCLNSLITLIMLKQFEMTSQQVHSYDLLHKINLKTSMQDLSREYIVTTMNNFKNVDKSTDQYKQTHKQVDNRFKQEYKYLKSRYTQICARDLNLMFDLFKQDIKDFKVKNQQMNNMIFVLLSKLHRYKHSKRKTYF